MSKLEKMMVFGVMGLVLASGGAFGAYWAHDEGGANVNAYTGLAADQDFTVYIASGSGAWYWGNTTWGMSTAAFDSSSLFISKSAGGTTWMTLDFTFDKAVRKFRFTSPMLPAANLVLGGAGEVAIDYVADGVSQTRIWGLTSSQWDHQSNVPTQVSDWVDFGSSSSVQHVGLVFQCLENSGTSYVGIWPFYAGGGYLEVVTAPEPVTMAFLVLGGVFGFIRRK